MQKQQPPAGQEKRKASGALGRAIRQKDGAVPCSNAPELAKGWAIFGFCWLPPRSLGHEDCQLLGSNPKNFSVSQVLLLGSQKTLGAQHHIGLSEQDKQLAKFVRGAALWPRDLGDGLPLGHDLSSREDAVSTRECLPFWSHLKEEFLANFQKSLFQEQRMFWLWALKKKKKTFFPSMLEIVIFDNNNSSIKNCFLRQCLAT
jgi:hypothetical protein